MQPYKMGIDIGSTTAKMVILDKDNTLVFSRYRRHNALPAGILTSFSKRRNAKWATSRYRRQ